MKVYFLFFALTSLMEILRFDIVLVPPFNSAEHSLIFVLREIMYVNVSLVYNINIFSNVISSVERAQLCLNFYRNCANICTATFRDPMKDVYCERGTRVCVRRPPLRHFTGRSHSRETAVQCRPETVNNNV